MKPRPEHRPEGSTPVCSKCGILASYHRDARNRSKRKGYFRERYEASAPRDIIAIDGEGYNIPGGGHRYTYLAACNQEELIAELVRPEGVAAEDVYDWLCDLPKESLKVGFALGYDITKWIESMPDAGIYAIMHPDMRQGLKGPRAVVWDDRWAINKVSTRFSVRDLEDARQCVVWDLFKFFQASFVKSLRNWKVGVCGPDCDGKKCEVDCTIQQISAMKDERGNFENPATSPEIQEYCRSECRLLAKLARTLLDAHETAGLSLRSFYGPGSTAAVMLDRMGAIDQKVEFDGIEELEGAADCAFFGGRFEPSHVGPIRKEIYERDIASAYPYAMARLPCLEHGAWKHVKGRKSVERVIKSCKTACVNYEILPDASCQVWGPLPHRLIDGNIIFPVSGPGGWAWLPEYEAACRLHAGVRAREAFVFSGACDCGRPYQKWIVEWYCERLRWGKDGPGLALKLGLNSCYGKSAQQVGSAKFRCMVRAGLITAMTRAMLLDAIGRASNPWNVVELATDSIATTEPLILPEPEMLGTEEAAAKAGKEPLGKWGEKATHGQGLFIMRPGQRFSLDLSSAEKSTAARGIGTRVLHANRQKVLDDWAARPMGETTVQQPAIFHGATSCVSRNKRTGAYVRHELYGRWEEPKPRKVNYAPAPKRSAVEAGGRPGEVARLTPWALDWRDRTAVSVAYTKAPKGQLALDAAEGGILADEQPDGGGIYLMGED